LRENIPNLNSIFNSLNIKELICANAERKSYGIKSKDSTLYEDASKEALW
jgi:hypothetical protein